MKRVVSLYLPNWSIDLLRRTERRYTRSAEARDASDAAGVAGSAAFDALGADAAAERAQGCSVPKEGGWRPGARWAKSERAAVEDAVAALPAHRRPPQRELDRVSQAADNPFRKGLAHPPEERVAPPAPLRELSRRTEAAGPLFRPGTRGWTDQDLQASVDAMPQHQRPSLQELSRKSEVVDNPFRPMPADEFGPQRRVAMPPLQFPGEDAPAKAGRGAALRSPSAPSDSDQPGRDRPSSARRGRYRNEAPHGASALRRAAAMPPVHGPGEDVVARRAIKAPRRSARDGHGGEAGYVAAPSLAQLALMPAVQFPGEGPHPDNHGKSEPTAPTYGQGRFFQTGRTLASVVARVCRDEDWSLPASFPDEPPLVTAHAVGPRVELAAVNPAARALGLSPGTALTMARAQVPGLEVRPADPDGDAAALRGFAELIARRWAPVVAVSDPDGLFVDLTGVAHLHGGEERFVYKLLRLLARHGVDGRAAVADTPGAAWALARYGSVRATFVGFGGHADAIAPLPVAALRLDAPSLELLARLGIDRVRQLLALPRAPLVRRFGRAIVDRLDQATGHAPEPLDPVVPPTRIAVERRFAEPIATPEAIEHALRGLMADLARALAETGEGARAVELVAARVDGVPQRLRLGFARPTRDAAHMLRLTLRRIEEIEPGYGLDALALHVRRADPLGPQALDAALAEEAEPDLAPLVDALANRIGLGRLWRAAPVESDVPERSVALAPPLDPPPDRMARLATHDVRRLDERAGDHPWHPRWPRPVRLLRRPEQVDHVIAMLPDQPPKRFTWRGTVHRVVRADGPERIAGEWWRRPAERRAVRDYFRVEDEAGARFWLYRRGDGVRPETGDLSWFMQAR